MSKITNRKPRNILLMLLISGILIVSAGCQPASDMFDRETYRFDNADPWERGIEKKPAAPKSAGEEL